MSNLACRIKGDKCLELTGRTNHLENMNFAGNFMSGMAAALIMAPVAMAQKITPSDTERAEGIVSKMTLEEKIDYIGGYNTFYIRPIARLGIPEIRMADGPQGVRNDTKSTLYPSGIAVASTWNRALARLMGQGLGMDSKARGVHILLGPGVNIYRSPLCGRNFEYMGEDPYLSGEMAASYIEGLQNEGVMACVKHFAGNNNEWDRHNTSSDIDERTLNEIYFPAFEKAVKKGGTGAVMCSYNLLNSVHASESPYLGHVLRNEWGFDGIFMSDWTSCYSTIGVAGNQLDLEMPSGRVMSRAKMLDLVKRGVIDERLIDRKIVHVLQTLSAFGFLDKPQKDSSIPEKNPFSDSVSLEISREALVLLKNEDGLLPVTKGRIVVCGPNSNVIVTGGGSGNVTPLESSTVLEGMGQMGKKIRVSTIDESEEEQWADFYADETLSRHGIAVEYFSNQNLSGNPVARDVADKISLSLSSHSGPAEGIGGDHFSIRYTAWCDLPSSRSFVLSAGSDDGSRLYLDGKPVYEDWSNHSYREHRNAVDLPAGKHKIVFEYYDDTSTAEAHVRMLTMPDSHADDLKAADAVVVCLGFSAASEKENSDRTYALPDGQEEYLEEVLKYNDNVVVVLNAGGAVDMSRWLDRVKAVIMAWYPGQRGGTAVAEVITGKVNPSGKLPISITSKIEELPSMSNYYENTERIRKGNPYVRIAYNEGIFVGYRGLDREGVKPLYEFGYGLSYTSFEYSDLQIAAEGDGYEVSFTVKNAGKVAGSEIAQVYVHDCECSLPRPEKELKGFEKVYLQPGESRRVSVRLDDEAFRLYDAFEHHFKVEPGDFDILVGASSRDIRLNGTVSVK